MDELKNVLKKLGNDKSRDAEGFANELFKEDAAGEDMLDAVLKLMNLIKKGQTYPQIMEKCKIISLHKKKCKTYFDNYQRVFRVGVLRSILDRLIYDSSYETIDTNLTDENVGARKRRPYFCDKCSDKYSSKRKVSTHTSTDHRRNLFC